MHVRSWFSIVIIELHGKNFGIALFTKVVEGIMAWNSDTTYALGLHRIMGRMVGIWPVDSITFTVKTRIVFVTIVPVWVCVDFIKQLLVKGYCGNATETVDYMTMNIMGLTVVIKMIVIIFYQNNMYSIVNSAVKDWAEIFDKKSRSIMLRYAYISRTVAIIAVIGLYLITIHLILTRLRITLYFWDKQSNSSIEQVYGVPLWPTCWIPTDISMYHYTIYFILQSIALIVINTSYCVYDILLLGIAMHLCGQFRVLYKNVDNIHKTIVSSRSRHQANKFIKRHNHLLKLAYNFEETYRYIILTDIGTAVLLISISGVMVLISLKSSDFVSVGAMIIRICLIYIQLFTYSYIGEQLTSQAEQLRMAIYNSPWYNMPPDIVRDMTFIIMRCNYPFNLTAGKICNLNIATFMSILKTITSYFSVIRLMFEESK